MLHVEENRLQIAKSVTLVISQNNLWARKSKDYSRRAREEDRLSRPVRDRVEDKRKSSDYSGSSAKRFKNDEEDFDWIFTMPQEKIFSELKDENVFRQSRQINVPEHMKDKSKF